MRIYTAPPSSFARSCPPCTAGRDIARLLGALPYWNGSWRAWRSVSSTTFLISRSSSPMQPVSLPTRSFIRSAKRDSQASWLRRVSLEAAEGGETKDGKEGGRGGGGKAHVSPSSTRARIARLSAMTASVFSMMVSMPSSMRPTAVPRVSHSLALRTPGRGGDAVTPLFQQTHAVEDLLLPLGEILHRVLQLRHGGAQLAHDPDLGRVSGAVGARRRRLLLRSVARLREDGARRRSAVHVQGRRVSCHGWERHGRRKVRVRNAAAAGEIHVPVRHPAGVAAGVGEVGGGAWVGHEGIARAGHLDQSVRDERIAAAGLCFESVRTSDGDEAR